MDQKKTIRPFSMKDKIGYTLGDLGCCFTEQYRAMYLSIFYTLILQVNPFHVGILLLITKIWDAVNDPIIGAMVDSRKATKGGKFIPWIRAFSFPMAVLCVLAFVNVGNISYGLRLAYMFITYVLYEALYTCVNVPFGTLSSVMTDDVSQRTALSRYRSLGGTIFMTVMVMVGPLFLYVDNQPVAGRFLMLACICAMLGLLCLQDQGVEDRQIHGAVLLREAAAQIAQCIADLVLHGEGPNGLFLVHCVLSSLKNR